MTALRFCAFVTAEVVCGLGIYAGAMMHHFRIVEVGIVAAVIALISYTAAEACVIMAALDKEAKDGGTSGKCEG